VLAAIGSDGRRTTSATASGDFFPCRRSAAFLAQQESRHQPSSAPATSGAGALARRLVIATKTAMGAAG